MIFSVCMAFVIIAKVFAKILEWGCIVAMWIFILGVKLAMLPVTITWNLIRSAFER